MVMGPKLGIAIGKGVGLGKGNGGLSSSGLLEFGVEF
jgi:hypothetical protein